MTQRVLLFAPHFEPGYRAGGTLRSLVNIVDTSPSTHHVLVMTSDRDLGADSPYPSILKHPTARGDHLVLYLPKRLSTAIFRAISAAIKFKPHIAYINSLWNPRYALIPILALTIFPNFVNTVIVAPRGQLHPNAASISPRRKRMALRLWRLAARRTNITWHATEAVESELIRAAFSDSSPIITSMDPTTLPPEPSQSDAPATPELQIAYVGRIAPVKNITTMVEGVCKAGREVRLIIAGPGEDPLELSRIEQVAKALEPHSVTISTTGAIPHDEILKILTTSHAMFFPTLGENFGHVIAESLSCSCPVICGPVTPFTQVISNGGGQIVDHRSSDAWANITKQWADMTPTQRAEKHRAAGEQYRAWARERDSSHIFSEVIRHQSEPL